MNIRITTKYSNTIVKDVQSFTMSECELSIYFNREHSYKNEEEFIEALDEALNGIGSNYHFNDPYWGTDLLVAYGTGHMPTVTIEQ